MEQKNYTTKSKYKQLTRDDRVIIESFLKEGYNYSAIANHLGVHRSTISREVKRGLIQTYTKSWKIQHEYLVDSAQALSTKRNLNSRKKPLYYGNKDILEDIVHDIHKHKWSFSIISGRYNLTGKFKVSTVTLYNWFKKGIIKIKAYLRPTYNFNKSTKEARGKRISHKSIDLRPIIANNRTEFGHWEMDTVMSSRTDNTCLLVLSERLTRSELIFKIPSKTKEQVKLVLDGLEHKFGNSFMKIFKTITTDNGAEFLDFHGIETSAFDSNQQRTNVYYAHPYSSWQRGTNENLNREIRRWCPKKTNFSKVSSKLLMRIQHWMNHKPRKILNYQTPYELLLKIHPELIDILN